MSCSGSNIIAIMDILDGRGSGVFGSVDAGATWNTLPGEIGKLPAWSVDMNDNGTRALLSSWNKVYLGTGNNPTSPLSWTTTLDLTPSEPDGWPLKAAISGNGNTMVAWAVASSYSTLTGNGVLYVSDNGGLVWHLHTPAGNVSC
jgi:hypothetical protein